MPDHLEIRLPEVYKAGMVGGPVFNTDVIEVDSGYEWRNDSSSGIAIREYEIEYIKDLDEAEQLSDFFHVVRGRSYSFRFKDWLDYQVTTGNGLIGDGTGDGVTTVYQLYKRYSFGGSSLDRIIQKLVAGTVQIYVNGVLQTITTHYTINMNTGIVTFLSAPTNGHVIAWSGEFDVPVRFTTDKFTCRLLVKDAVYEVVGLGLKEVRV